MDKKRLIFMVAALSLLGGSLWADSGVLVSSSNSSEKNNNSTLVSDSYSQTAPASSSAASSEAPVPPGKIRLKFKPKTQPAVSPYVPQKTAAMDVVKKSQEEDAEDFELGISKNSHPASTKPEAVNPFVQTVNGPKTLDYTKPRPAHVLDPGKQKGTSTGRVTGTIRPAQTSN